MTRGVGYLGTRDPNVAGVSSSGVSGRGVIAEVDMVGTVSGVTWSPAAKGASLTLSNGNLTVTNTNAGNDWDAVLGTLGESTGKRYYEVVLENMPFDGDFMFGVAKSTASVISYVGSDLNGWGWQVGGTAATKHNNASGTAYGTAGATTGSVIGVLLDLDAGELSFTLNGVSQGVAFTGLSGEFFPAASLYYLTPSATARFTPASWSYQPPTGYDSWN